MNYPLYAVVTGAGATLVVDAWAVVRHRWFGIAPPNYALVGRWFGHMPGGRFRHSSIQAATSIRGEWWLGWSIHYITGIAFAAVLLGVGRAEWAAHPTLGPALATGIATIVAPFLLMQPGMGAGIAGSRTARPASARMQSLVTHTVFGGGLYVAGWLAHYLCR